MKISLPYGREELTCELDAVQWTTLKPGPLTNSISESDVLRGPLKKCVNAVKDYHPDTVLLIVPDHTRLCSLDKVLPTLVHQLSTATCSTLEILVANGSHALQDESVIRELVTDNVFDRFPVYQHDCKDDTQLSFVGETDYQTPLYLNQRVVKADLVITLGGVLYHYFAGFGGGVKMIFPGTAGYETIRQNHQRTIDPEKGRFHPNCREGNLDTNPVFKDLEQIVKFVPNWISLQWLVSIEGTIIQALCGPVQQTHRNICKKVKRVYSIPIREKADVVVASAGGEPTDINLIQSHKSIHHAYQAVKKGGLLLIAAKCRQGIGSETFMPYFRSASSTEIANALIKNYQINGHTALALREKAENAEIVLISDLDSELVRKTGMIPCRTCNEAEQIVKKANPVKGYIFPMAHLYVPIETS